MQRSINLKHKPYVRNVALLLVLIIASAILPSCKEDDGSGYIFKMNIENNPQNLDPQMASDKESILIISNMMQGLVKELPSGAIVPAAAESFEMSDDGLVYTFYLHRDSVWDSLAEFSEPVTADDFLYAFQRIFDPATRSPYMEDYAIIKNGNEVFRGIKNMDELGVKVLNDYTLEITLNYPYYDFLTLLSKTAAMPCSRSFFELSKGRYGVSAETAASNGAFYLKEWNFDPYWNNNYIIMRRNAAYSEKNYVYPYGLNFFIKGSTDSDRSDFLSDTVQCYLTDEYDENLFSVSSVCSASSKTAGLAFNINSQYFGNERIRSALAASVNRESYAPSLPPNLTVAYGIIPHSVTVQGKNYRDLMPDKTISVYNTEFAGLWANALKSAGIEAVDNVKITVSENFSGTDMIYELTDRWRSELMFYCGVEIVSENEYSEKLENGEYDIALIELGAEQNSAYEFLKNMTENPCFRGYANTEFMSDLAASASAVSLSSGAELLNNAEKAVIDDCMFVPLCYENEYLVYSSDASDIGCYPFTGVVSFEKAKYFD